MRTIKSMLLLAAVMVGTSSLVAVAQNARPYAQGTVTTVSFIRTKPGMFDAYMKWVATDRKVLMEEYKKQGLIVSYNVYSNQPRDLNDADIILTVTYKNWAAFDGLSDRQDAVITKVVGSTQKATEQSISREAMRTQLGSQTLQELVLK
jgi:hypothetical protein